MKTILLVDVGSDLVAEMICEDTLSEQGYNVISGHDAPELENAAQAQKPDLLLLNVDPFEERQLALLYDIKRRWGELPFLASTLFPARLFETAARHPDGPSRIISDMRQLIEAIDQSIRQSRIQRSAP